MTDSSFTAISAMVLLLIALSTRRAPTAAGRQGRTTLLVVLAIFVGGSYFLNNYVSAIVSSLWAVGFWTVLAVWGLRMGDRGMTIIGAIFAVLYFAVGVLMPLLMA